MKIGKHYICPQAVSLGNFTRAVGYTGTTTIVNKEDRNGWGISNYLSHYSLSPDDGDMGYNGNACQFAGIHWCVFKRVGSARGLNTFRKICR